MISRKTRHFSELGAPAPCRLLKGYSVQMQVNWLEQLSKGGRQAAHYRQASLDSLRVQPAGLLCFDGFNFLSGQINALKQTCCNSVLALQRALTAHVGMHSLSGIIFKSKSTLPHL